MKRGEKLLARKRRKQIKMFRSAPIIYIATIVMLNLMGVSYAYWNDSTSMNVSVSTGFIDPYFELDETRIVGSDKGELTLRLSEDQRRLEINGWCYPTFNENLFIKVKNRGTIPVSFSNLEALEASDLIKQVGEPQYRMARAHGGDQLIGEEDEKPLKLHIQAENQGIRSMRKSLMVVEEPASEEHSFVYELQFEQGLK